MSYSPREVIETSEEESKGRKRRRRSRSPIERTIEEESKGKKRHSSKDTRLVPRSSLDKETFETKFPHINVNIRGQNVSKFSYFTIMSKDVLKCLMQYIFSVLEANTGVWYGAERYLASTMMPSRHLHLTFFTI
jgi:hypothetical protein